MSTFSNIVDEKDGWGSTERLSAFSDDEVKVAIDGEHGCDEPSIEQFSAWKYKLDNETLIRDAVLNAILAEYPKMQKAYEYVGNDLMPACASVIELQRLLNLSQVHISTFQKEGLAYIGFEFGCTWDDEHGLGVMTHKDRVLDLGLSEVSFMRPGDKDATEINP